MISLLLTFCMIATGECSTLRAEKPYPSYEACDLKGARMVTSPTLGELLESRGLRLDDWACEPVKEVRG